MAAYVFEFQFETAASGNGWDDDEKALEIILALKNVASGILESVQTSRRNNYNGDEQKRELYCMELRCQEQKANDPLQAFALEVDRLVQLTYPGENHPLIDNIKIGAFVDSEIKLAICSMQKITFAETTAFALEERPVARFQDHQLAKGAKQK